MAYILHFCLINNIFFGSSICDSSYDIFLFSYDIMQIAFFNGAIIGFTTQSFTFHLFVTFN